MPRPIHEHSQLINNNKNWKTKSNKNHTNTFQHLQHSQAEVLRHQENELCLSHIAITVKLPYFDIVIHFPSNVKHSDHLCFILSSSLHFDIHIHTLSHNVKWYQHLMHIFANIFVHTLTHRYITFLNRIDRKKNKKNKRFEPLYIVHFVAITTHSKAWWQAGWLVLVGWWATCLSIIQPHSYCSHHTAFDWFNLSRFTTFCMTQCGFSWWWFSMVMNDDDISLAPLLLLLSIYIALVLRYAIHVVFFWL